MTTACEARATVTKFRTFVKLRVPSVGSEFGATHSLGYYFLPPPPNSDRQIPSVCAVTPSSVCAKSSGRPHLVPVTEAISDAGADADAGEMVLLPDGKDIDRVLRCEWCARRRAAGAVLLSIY